MHKSSVESKVYGYAHDFNSDPMTRKRLTISRTEANKTIYAPIWYAFSSQEKEQPILTTHMGHNRYKTQHSQQMGLWY